MKSKSQRFLINAQEATELLGISPRTLWALTNSGEIPHLRIGRAVRYSVEDLRDWIELRTVGGNR